LDNPAVWAEVPTGLRERVLAEALGTAPGGVEDEAGHEATVTPPVVDLPRHAARTRGAHRRAPVWRRPALLAAAAIVVVGLAVAGGMQLAGNDTAKGREVALAGTDAQPGASATVRLQDEPSGVSVTLNVSGLPRAPDDAFYEVWFVGATGKVSAGTFHLREPQDKIQLWLGVDTSDYDAITITRQPMAGGSTAQGVVLLRGELPH